MNDDFVLLIAISAGSALFLLAVLAVLILAAVRPRLKLKQRIKALGSLEPPQKEAGKPDAARFRRMQERLNKISRVEHEGFMDHTDTALLQAGLKINVKTFLQLCALAGTTCAVVGAGLNLHVVAIISLAVVGGVGLPKLILSFLSARRQQAFATNFSDAIDIIARGILSGLPVGECLSMVAREFDGPVGEEFTILVEGQRLGMSLDTVLAKATKRMPMTEFKFFAVVLQVQRQTGGNLAATLENLSDVLRERKRMKDKIKALSSEAKSSAAIIASLPFLVLGLLAVVNPVYVNTLFSDGMHLVYIALAMMAVGIGVMRQMINFDI